MDMSPHTSLEESAGCSEVYDILRDVLLQHHPGLKVQELREVLKQTHQIDLENLRKELGFGNLISFLAQLPGYRLLHPELHGNCVITQEPKPGCTDPFYTHQKSEEQCWNEDSIPDNFLLSTSPVKVNQTSPEKPTSHHPKAPTTTGMDCTAVQPKATVSSSTRHPGCTDGPQSVSPCWNLPDTTSSHDQAISPVDTLKGSTATVPQRLSPKRKPSGMDEEILSVLTQPMFASGIRLCKLVDILNVELGINLEERCWGMGFKHPLDLLCHVPNVKLMDPSKGQDCVVKFQPGMDEEILSVLTQPMFASGIRLCKLIEILNVELGIDLEELCWDMGYKNPLDLLRHVPNIKLMDPSKGQDCVVKFQPGKDEEIFSVLTQSMLTSGIRLCKLVEILNVELGIDLEELCRGMGYKQPLDLLHHVPNVKLLDPSKGEDCIVKFQPGVDEEILSILTQPMFASGIRLYKLVEILNEELGIDLEELCWGMGYKHPLDLLHHVPNVKLMDPSKGQDCVVQFQPGFKGNQRNYFLRKMSLPPITTLGQRLKTELKDSPQNYTSHDFHYPVPPNSSKKQGPNSSQNGANNISKYLLKAGPPYPSQNKSKGASVTVYTSKHHQKVGLPQQKIKPGSTMVFHASKTSVFVGPLNTTKTYATKSTYYMPYQNMDTFSNPAFSSRQHSSSNPKEQLAFHILPSHKPSDHSQDDSLSSLTQPPDSHFFNPPADKGIDPVLKDEILVVLLQQPEGVGFGEFAGLFHRTHGYQLKICRHGFISLRELLDEMADLVKVSADPQNPLIKCRCRHHYVFIGGGPFSSRI